MTDTILRVSTALGPASIHHDINLAETDFDELSDLYDEINEWVDNNEVYSKNGGVRFMLVESGMSDFEQVVAEELLTVRNRTGNDVEDVTWIANIINNIENGHGMATLAIIKAMLQQDAALGDIHTFSTEPDDSYNKVAETVAELFTKLADEQDIPVWLMDAIDVEEVAKSSGRIHKIEIDDDTFWVYLEY